MSLQRVSGGDADDDDAVDEEAMDSVTGNKKHYSGSYLETYSTLMDIPHSLLHQEMEEEEAVDAHDQLRVTVLSAVSQHKSTPALLGNIGSGRSEEGDGKEEDSDREQYGGRGDGDHSHSQSDGDGDSNDDGNDDDGERKGDDEAVARNVMTLVVERLNAMEQRMDSQFQTINARLTILEGKVKLMESQRRAPSTTTTTTTTTAQSEESKQQKPSSSVAPTDDNRTFAESTIGSSSLPISLTPGPIGGAALRNRRRSVDNKLNATTFPIRSSLTAHKISNQPTAVSMPPHRHQHRPKHIHAPTARSPFLSGTGRIDRFQGYMPSTNGRNESTASTTNGYRGNVMCDVMAYPLSSSSSNERRENVPKIQSLEIGSSGDRSGGGRSVTESDPDSTLNFINDLKEMLKSTDKLLMAKPINLYDP